MNKINLADKFSLFSEHWRPKVVGALGHEQALARK